MASSFEVEAMVRGYHEYKEMWEAEVGEQLEWQRETSIPHDLFAVTPKQAAAIEVRGTECAKGP